MKDFLEDIAEYAKKAGMMKSGKAKLTTFCARNISQSTAVCVSRLDVEKMIAEDRSQEPAVVRMLEAFKVKTAKQWLEEFAGPVLWSVWEEPEDFVIWTNLNVAGGMMPFSYTATYSSQLLGSPFSAPGFSGVASFGYKWSEKKRFKL